MNVLRTLIMLFLFPGGLFVLLNGLAYEWAKRKLLAKEEIVPEGVDRRLFAGLQALIEGQC